MPKVKKVKKPLVRPEDYPDYGDYLAAKKLAEEKENKNES